MDSNQSFNNRADITDGDNQIQDCSDHECCGERLAFAMKDKYHEFSIGLSTILHCLAVAEQEGYVPKLPNGWWSTVMSDDD